jgi:hypothetical protein
MVDYASRMLSGFEDFSVQGSRNGRVAFHSLLLRRSLATGLWNQHDGVLNQIMGVGPKTTASLKLHGISSFTDVINATDEKIETAAQRAPPFGSTLRRAVTKILQGRMKLTASIEYVPGSRTPYCLNCRVESSSECLESAAQGASPSVSYTLVAFTDRPGGCLLFQRNVSSEKLLKVHTPPEFGTITVALIASIVGLDGKSSMTCMPNTQKRHSPAFKNR